MGSAGHVPLRTCIGCRRRCPMEELRALSLVGDRVVPAPRKRRGRGAWIHVDAGCIEAAVKTRAFGRAFRAAAQSPDAGTLYAAMQGRLEERSPGE